MMSAGPISKRLTAIMEKKDFSRQEQSPSAAGITIRLAVSEEDFSAAYHLIYKQYLGYGYMDTNPAEMRINFWNLLPATYTVIAEKDGEVVGTVSYIVDTDAGLPMDEVAEDELNSLRTCGRHLCEISGLAVDDARAGNETLLMMIRYGYHLSSSHLAVDGIVITVNPRHEKFYKRMLAFKQIADTVEYTKVKQAPGVPLFLDLRTAETVYFKKYAHRQGSRNLHRFFVGEGTDELKRDITRDVWLRNRSVTLSFVRQVARNASGILNSTRQRDLLDYAWANDREVSATVA